MSVWPNTTSTSSPALCGSEGELISVSVIVEPRDLEKVLEALAMLDFPVNPQIYHDAAVISVEHSGRERVDPTTIVEFPAYAERLERIRRLMEGCGFRKDALSVSPMLDDLHSDEHMERAPAAGVYAYRIFRKHATALMAGPH